MRKMSGKEHFNMKQQIKKFLNLTEEEVAALESDESGKTVKDLMEEKGVTKEEIKEQMLEDIINNFNETFDKKFERIEDKEVSKILSKKGQKRDFSKKIGINRLAKKTGLTIEEIQSQIDDGKKH